MARTLVAPQVLANQDLNVAANGRDLTQVAADATNFNDFVGTGKELLIVDNSGATAHTITIYAASDTYGRTGKIDAYSLGAGEKAVFGPFPTTVYNQTNGHVNVDCNHAELKLSVVKLP